MTPHPQREPYPTILLGRTLVLCLGVAVALGLWQERIRAQTPDSMSVVRGRLVEHETGIPLAGAAVSLASGPGPTRGIGTRVTDSDGQFLFRTVPPGSYRIIVSQLGYRELRDTLQVEPGSDLDLQLPLSVSPIRLEPLVVVSERRPRPGPLRDFEERRRTRSGTFFDREDIEERNPVLFSDLFRMVPGARVLPSGSYDYSIRLRGGCRPTLWVDGMPLMTSEGADHLLQTMDLEAVEVYNGPTLPVEFGSNPCGGIVVWTRRGEPVVGKGSFWRRMAFAVGFLTLAFIVTD